jgi:hypothetical protein
LPVHTSQVLALNDDQNEQALVAWQKLLEEPEVRMEAEVIRRTAETGGRCIEAV